MIMSAVAAVLAGVIALQAYRPDLLPTGLRVKPKVQIVEVPAPPAPQASQFVALLQPNASMPAFILTVDTRTKTFTVRKVGATPQPGKSYELWLVSDRLPRPWSLGVIGGADFTVRPSTTSYDADLISKATYAVTLEPEGGSSTGIPTGPIVYTGKLIETVPTLPAR
jgi:anti-sigma-K factor RskA